MNHLHLISISATVLLFLAANGLSPVAAADIDTRLSSRDAYVGAPLTLQITISDASDYQLPQLPVIDGCDVRSAGTPMQSSSLTIINGRRRQSHSVTFQYLITPRRTGEFSIPGLEMMVDGRTGRSDPKSFVATKSETGDLMYAKIEGGKSRVFVGQPLDMTLNIWIKPFRDPSSGQSLTEGEMWNMIASSTSWGGFSGRMKELSENRQRPGGQQVARFPPDVTQPESDTSDESGDYSDADDVGYYLYEIRATIYPKRPGRIDTDDVQIVVNYPTAIGRARSPLDSFFGSPFSNRLRGDGFSADCCRCQRRCHRSPAGPDAGPAE